MCRTLVDLALQVRLFLMYESRKLGSVVTKGMSERYRKLLLLLVLLLLLRLALPRLGLLRLLQFGAHEWLTDLLFDSCTQITWRIAAENAAYHLK